MNERLDKPPNEAKQTEKLHLNNVQLLGFDEMVKKKRYAEKAPARKKRLVSPVREQFKEIESEVPKLNSGPLGS